MKQLRVVCLALVSLCVLGVVFATAAAAEKCKCLPDIHFLPGEKEATIEGTLKKAGGATLTSEVGTKLEADELKILATLKELSALGPIDLHFVNTKITKGEKCNTEADDVAGQVLVKGEYHLVFISYEPLTVGLLILFPEGGGELTIECSLKGKKLKFKGPIIASVSGLKDMTDTLEFKIGAKCKGVGKQELTSYFNDEGKEVAKQLILANLGLGLENACEELGEEVTMKSNRMLEPLI